MNKKARLNYIHAMSTQVEHKKMYKAKKQWVVAGISFLVATGMGAIGNHLTTHAATNNPTTNRVVSGANNTQKVPASASSKGITSQAIDLHSKILNNANPIKTSATPASNKASGNQASSSNAKSLVASNVATSGNNGMNTLKLGDSSEQNKGWNYVQYGTNNNDVVKPSNNSNSRSFNKNISASVATPKSKVSANPINSLAKRNKTMMLNANVGMVAPSDENAPKGYSLQSKGMWGQAYWKFYKNGQLDIYDGDMQTATTPSEIDPSAVYSIKTSNVIAPKHCANIFDGTPLYQYSNSDSKEFNDKYNLNTSSDNPNSHFYNLQSADLSGFDTSNTYTMASMFRGDSKLVNIKFGPSFNTKNVVSMYSMFNYDTSLQSLNLSLFNTQSCQDYNAMFAGDTGLNSLDLQGFIYNKGTNAKNMFALVFWPNQKSNLKQLVLNTSFKNLDTNDAHLNSDGIGNTPSGFKWSDTAHNPGNYIDNNYKQQYTIKFFDDAKNTQVGPQQSFDSIKGTTYVPINSSIVPNGYILAPNAGTTAKVVNGNTATINVIPNNTSNYGIWGNANWILYNNGQLQLLNGALETSQVPSDLNVNSVKSITTQNVASPGDASNLFVPFNNSTDFDLRGMNFSSASNLGDVVPDTDASVEFNATYYDTLNREQANQIASDNAKANSEAASAETAASESASLSASSAYSNASSYVLSASSALQADINNINNLTNTGTSLSTEVNSAYTTISNDASLISAWSTSSSAISTSLASASSSNYSLSAASTLASNSLSSASVALSSDATKISNLQNMQVIAYLVNSTDNGINPIKAVGVTAEPKKALNAVSLGTLGNFKPQNLLSAIPSGYHIKPLQKLGLRKITLGDSRKPLLTMADNSDTQSDNVTVYGNPVDYKVNIQLNFRNGKNNLNNLKTINLSQNTISTEVGNYINALDGHNNGSSDNTDPTKQYLNTTIDGFKTNNFTADSSNPPASQYEFQVPTTDNGGNTTTSKTHDINLVFNFNANGNIPFNVYYQYTDKNGHTHNEGSHIFKGINDTHEDVNSDVANQNGLNGGWQLKNADNTINFGNNSNGSMNIAVEPKSASAHIYYYSNDKTKPLASDTLNGNDSRATDAGDTNVDITKTNQPSIPQGYNLSNPNNKILFNNGSYYIQVVGQSHKGRDKKPINYKPNNSDNKKHGNTSSDITPTPSTKPIHTITPGTTPYTPAKSDTESDTFYVGINKYSNGKFIGNYAKRFTISEKTGSTFTIDPNAFTPNGYKLTNSDKLVNGTVEANYLKPQSVIFNYDAIDNYNPQTEKNNPKASDAITFDYVNSKNNKLVWSDVNAIHGLTDTQQTYTPKATTGYNINGNQNYTYNITSNHQTEVVYITPKTATDTIQYMYNGQLINKYVPSDKATATYSGSDSSAKNADNTNFKIGSNPTNLDNRFHVVNPNQSFNYDNGTHQVQVVPINATIAVNYFNQNGTPVDSDGKPQLIKMSDLTNHHLSDTVGSQINIMPLLTAPNGYHFANNEAAPVTLNTTFYNTKHTVGSMPVMFLNMRLGTENTNASTKANNAKVNFDSSAVTSDATKASAFITSSTGSSAKSTINSDINKINQASSAIQNDMNQGTSQASSEANSDESTAASAYSDASRVASNVTKSAQNSSASASLAKLASLVASDVKSNQSTNTGLVSLTSDEEQTIANDIDGNIKSTTSVVTNTVVDHSALTSLTNEVATNNSEINSLATKPANSTTNTIDYNYFNNLVNSGVSQLTDVLNKDFKADIHNVHANSVKTPVKRVRKYIRWIMITKPLKLYNKATMVNGKHGVVKVLKPNHKITLDVKEVFRVRNHNVFKISYHHHNYFIADNHKLVKNAYLSKSYNLIGKKVRVLHDVYAYRHKASDRVKTLHRGFTARIKNVVKIGRYNMTRIQLSNGNWISANKNFVKVL